MLGPLKAAIVSVAAASLGVFGLGLSVAAIIVRWLPLTSYAKSQHAVLEAPVPAFDGPSRKAKAARRRSVPTTSKEKQAVPKRKIRRRPASLPSSNQLPQRPSTPNSSRRVCFADAPPVPTTARQSRFSISSDGPIKPILNSPLLAEARIPDSPRSSLSSFPVLATIPSLNEEELRPSTDSDNSSMSSRPSVSSYSSYLSRIQMPKLYNPLGRRKKRTSGGSVSSLATSTITTPESPGLPTSPLPSESPSESPVAVRTKPPRRSSLGWAPWTSSSRRGSLSGPEETNTTTTRRIYHTKSVSQPDDDTTVTTTTTTSVVSTIVSSAGYFSKKPQKAKRRTSLPVPRTQPYEYPINAAYPTMYDETFAPPPPYQKSESSSEQKSEHKDSDVSSTIKRERNAQAQAALGVGGGRRPSLTRRAATYGC